MYGDGLDVSPVAMFVLWVLKICSATSGVLCNSMCSEISTMPLLQLLHPRDMGALCHALLQIFIYMLLHNCCMLQLKQRNESFEEKKLILRHSHCQLTHHWHFCQLTHHWHLQTFSFSISSHIGFLALSKRPPVQVVRPHSQKQGKWRLEQQCYIREAIL